MKWLLIILIPVSGYSAPARKLVVHKDEVVTVRTAIGIATIIQIPDQPTSLVLGDSAAFKVEYLDQAITIKPLHYGATSNLYIHTDYERFCVKLVTGQQSAADYVVYLTPYRAPKPTSPVSEPSLRWKKIGSSRSTSLGKVTLTRIAKSQSAILVEFEIVASQDEKLDPGVFWLTQGSSVKPIQDLLLSGLKIKNGERATATLIIKQSELTKNMDASVQIRMKRVASFLLTKETLWKN